MSNKKKSYEELVDENVKLAKIVLTQTTWIKSINDHYQHIQAIQLLIINSLTEAQKDFTNYFENVANQQKNLLEINDNIEQGQPQSENTTK